MQKRDIMSRDVLACLLLLFIAFYSLYNEYSAIKSCKKYIRKKDIIIKFLEASEEYDACLKVRNDCNIQKVIYKKEMKKMDIAIFYN